MVLAKEYISEESFWRDLSNFITFCSCAINVEITRILIFFLPAIVGVKQKCKGARLYWIDSQQTKICVKSILRGKLWSEFPVAVLENELIPSIFWDRYPITKQLVPIRISSVCSRSSITDAIKKQISLHLIGPVPATGDGGISWRFLPARPDPLEWERK